MLAGQEQSSSTGPFRMTKATRRLLVKNSPTSLSLTSLSLITLSMVGFLLLFPLALVNHVSAQDDAAKAKAAQVKKDAEKKEGDAEESKDDNGTVGSIKRPETPPNEADPSELTVKPGPDNRMKIDFRGQAWPAFLEWLASIGNYSLDWQELPNDYLNLSTTRRLTIDETRDLANRLLLDRGYTMILNGQVLSVVKIENLDPSLLTRVEDESRLLDLPAHDFVKITFRLPDELKADKAAEDVKPLLSAHAKVQPLMATNRLLVIDAVTNLREVSRLVNAEHSAATSHTVPNEFHIRFARADHVADQVMILLGLDPSSRRTPQELQVEQQRLQLFKQLSQKGKDVSKYLNKDGPKVFLAVNHRNNSILANAEPAEMRIIKRSIDMLDVPNGSFSGVMSSTLSMQKYKLVTISPESMVSALEEIGNMDPRTRFKTDAVSKTIFATATERDHEKIRSMIGRLDGSGRKIEVIWLRRLPADAVAVTIKNLLVGKEEKESTGRRIYYYGYYGRSGADQGDDSEFRVEADVERNRLILFANESELEEVRSLLAKLGEIPGASGNPNTVRILGAREPGTTARLLEQVQRTWSAMEPNEIHIQGTENLNKNREAEAQNDSDDSDNSDGSESEVTTGRDLKTAKSSRSDSMIAPISADPQALYPEFKFVASPAANADDQAQSVDTNLDDNSSNNASVDTNQAPPITITIADDGRIILSSADTRALDRLESLVTKVAPAPKNYKVFYLKYALASIVTLNLEEYFEQEGEFDTEENWMRAYYGFNFEESDPSGGSLARRRKMRFIYDYDTNSILVANASPEQLETVEALINIYDQKPSEDSISARSLKIFKLQYSSAEKIAKTIKEVFRDLLSSKDKAFSGKEDKKQGTQSTTTYYRIYGGMDTNEKKPTKVKASFDGALSVGVDELSNTLIVSAQEEWMPSIEVMIKELDLRAKPNTAIEVHRVNAQINGAALRAALANAMNGAKPSETKEDKEGQDKQQEGPNNAEQRNGRPER